MTGRRGISPQMRLGFDWAALLLLRDMPFCRLSLCISAGQVWQGWLACFIFDACMALDQLAEVRFSLDYRCLQQFLISSSYFFILLQFSNFSSSFCLRRSSTCRSSSAFISLRLRQSCCCSLRQNSLERRPRLWLRCYSSFIFYLSNIVNYYYPQQTQTTQYLNSTIILDLRKRWVLRERIVCSLLRQSVIIRIINLDSNHNMDFGINQRSLSPRQYRKMDNISQVSGYSNPNIQLKPVELLCHLHTEEPCNNYCVEGKCFQPLCAECIEGHLMLHKKNGYSDLSVKSLRSVRRDCAGKLTALIEELMRRLQQLQAPPSAEKVMEALEIRLEQAQKEAHQIIELQFTRLRDSLRGRVNEASNILRGMAEIHGKLETIIQQMKQTCNVISEGRRGSLSLPQCIKNTLTLNEQGLLDGFEKEGVAYQARRRKVEFQVNFSPELFKAGLADALKVSSVGSGKSGSPSEASFSRPITKKQEDSSEWDNSVTVSLPLEADPQEGNRLLHFFETGSSRLHLVEVQGRKKGEAKVVTINEFIVPSFHASLVSQSGEFIYLSGGLVQLNGRSKSPLFMRYNIRSQVSKKDFAKVTPRSSHSLCQDKNGDIFILGGYGQVQSEEESLYLTTVERVSQRTGKVEIQPDSRWGGSNIAFRCKELIVKACEQGIELYNPKLRHWTTVDIRTQGHQFIFFKSAGFACLNESQMLIFGGYQQNLQPTDSCFYWRLSTDGHRATMQIKELNCRLPVPEGFDNGKAVVDQRGCFALQNIEDDEDSCLDNERRLLRFDLKEGEGDWRVVQTISS